MKERKEFVKEFAEDASMLMMAAALVHRHRTGKFPYGAKDALNVMKRTGDLLKEKKGLEQTPDPFDTGKFIAKRLMQILGSKQCKGLTMPAPAFLAWLAFLQGGRNMKPPITGKIKMHPGEGDMFVLHIEVDSKGKGSVYRYHDPDGDSTIIGREIYMQIGND